MKTESEPLAWLRAFGFEDQSFAGQALRALGQTYENRADIGEVLSTVHRIADGDIESWYAMWHLTAERVYGAGAESERRGHAISAGQAFLRASNYYRAAEFYMHAVPDDPRALRSAQAGADAFKKAIDLLSIPAEVARVPYEQTHLPGYFYRSPLATGNAPLLVVQTGFDGTAEELHGIAMAAIRRGYHCLTVEGPGQGQVLRAQGLRFRPDWENVLTPIIDHAVSTAEVDADRIAVLGMSFGGHLIPRAAAFEHRPKLYIANSGMWSFYEVVTSRLPPDLMRLLDTDPEAFDTALRGIANSVTALNWLLNDGKWKFGGETPSELMLKMRAYSLDESNVAKIESHLLVVDAEADALVPLGQAKRLYDAASGPKDWLFFTADESAEAHCQAGAHAVLSERIFDRMDEFFSAANATRPAAPDSKPE
ncbi:MAG: alpha/beta hydrolase [bacterium]|nr:alpha/beta hydrolase [bacterium]